MKEPPGGGHRRRWPPCEGNEATFIATGASAGARKAAGEPRAGGRRAGSVPLRSVPATTPAARHVAPGPPLAASRPALAGGGRCRFSEGPGRQTRNGAVTAFPCWFFFVPAKPVPQSTAPYVQSSFVFLWGHGTGSPGPPCRHQPPWCTHPCWGGDGPRPFPKHPTRPPRGTKPPSRPVLRGVIAKSELVSLVVLPSWLAVATATAAPEQRLWWVLLLVQSPLLNHGPERQRCLWM